MSSTMSAAQHHTVYTQKLTMMREAFEQADSDSSGKLTEDQFKQFVKLGYKKDCPPGMYAYLCNHFGVTTGVGLSWKEALSTWISANPAPTGYDIDEMTKKLEQRKLTTSSNNLTTSTNQLKSKTPSPQTKNRSNTLSKNNSTHHVNFQNRSQSPQPNTNSDINRRQSRGGRTSMISKSRRNLSLVGTGDIAPSRSPSPLPGGNNSNSNSGSRHNKTNSMSNSNSHAISPRVERKSSIHHPNNNNNTERRTSHRRGPSTSGTFGNEDSDSEHSMGRRISARGNHPGRQKSRVLDLGADGSSEAQTMVVQMMESKLKNVQNQLRQEIQKRKKAEETTQQLLLTNEKYKQQLSEVETKNKKLERDSKSLADTVRKYKNQLDDDRNSFTHLKSQVTTMKSERDEAFKILRKIEKEHATRIQKLKKEHSLQKEKLSHGFLQSLGVDPSSGKDVREVIKELKEGNAELSQQVDMLAERLSRKEQSLFDALEMLDTVAQSRRPSITEDSKESEVPKMNNRKTSIAENLKNNIVLGLKNSNTTIQNGQPQLKDRTGGGGGTYTPNNNNSAISSTITARAKSPLPAPPINRRKSRGLHSAEFYKHASSPRGNYGSLQHRQFIPNNTQYHKNSRLNKNNISKGNTSVNTHAKSMEMLNNSLVSDLGNKQVAIDDLSSANGQLLDQVTGLQKQLDDMRRNSTILMQQHQHTKGTRNNRRIVNRDSENSEDGADADTADLP